jgi:hypothetical protein
LMRLKTRGIQGLDAALAQTETILRSVKAHHLFTKGREEKRQVLTRILTEVGELMVQTRPLVERLSASWDRVIQSARSRLMAMHEVIKPLMGQIVHGLTTGKVAANKIVHVGIPQARAIVRNKAGKKTEFGLAYLISRLGGGYVFGERIAANADERQMPLKALAGYRAILGPKEGSGQNCVILYAKAESFTLQDDMGQNGSVFHRELPHIPSKLIAWMGLRPLESC